MHNLAVARINQRVAYVLLGFGLLGMVTMANAVSKDLQILMFRRRLNLKGDAPVAEVGEKEEGDMTQGIILPPSWDKESISIVLRDLQNRPGAVSVFTQALVERFVTGQDDKTAKVRIEYLKTKLEELKITKELQGELDDLLFRQADLDVRRLQKEIEKGDLEHRRRTQNELRAAEHKRDLLKVKAEAAAYEKQIREARPEKSKSATSAAGKVQELEDRIRRTKELRAYARETTVDPDELRRKENQFDDKLAELEEEINSLL
jgi:hypothetical protein